MTRNSMRPDLDLWVETATAKHLVGKIPLDSVHAFLIGRSLAELLWHWRYDVPPKWDNLIVNADFSLIARQFVQDISFDVDYTDIDAAVPKVYDALEKGDWESMAALPDIVWQWLEELTCITKAEWENVPALTFDMLNKEALCKTCGRHGSIGEISRVKGAPDPFMFGGSSSLHLTCSRCDTDLEYNLRKSEGINISE